MNIYSYWLGDESKKEEIISKYKGLEGAKLLIEPSNKDHKELLKKYKFYRDAVRKKIFSFASDIWRAWAIKKYGDGLYIDTSVEIKIQKLNRYIQSIKDNKYQFEGFLENPTKVASCVFYSTRNSTILDDYLYYYTTYKCCIKLFKIAPEILTKAVHKSTDHISTTISTLVRDVKLNTLGDIVLPNGKTGIEKFGDGSWNSNKATPEDRRNNWIRKAKQFDTGFTQKEIKHYIKSDLKRGLWKLRNR